MGNLNPAIKNLTQPNEESLFYAPLVDIQINCDLVPFVVVSKLVKSDRNNLKKKNRIYSYLTKNLMIAK